MKGIKFFYLSRRFKTAAFGTRMESVGIPPRRDKKRSNPGLQAGWAPFLGLLFSAIYVFFHSYIVSAQETAALSQGPQLEYTASDLRDPFKEYIQRKSDEAEERQAGLKEEEIKKLPAMTVEGIIWGGKINQAIIDGTVVKAGDIINEAEITAIDKDGITFLYYGRQYKISSPAVSQ